MQSSPVVVGIINPQDDLSDGGQPALVLGRDVEDVGGEGLHLDQSEVSIVRPCLGSTNHSSPGG